MSKLHKPLDYNSLRASEWRAVAKKVDIVIIGGGIIGVTLAIEIATRASRFSVLLIEKENSLGLHASGRNSGVIHAGFYYSPHSLKAKFCRDGNAKMVETCSKLGVPIRKTGKVVVAQESKETPELENLFERAIANEVSVEIFEDNLLSKFEPLARSKGGFIWSPNTYVGDPVMLLNKLEKKALDLGIQFVFGITPEFFDGKLILDGESIDYKHLINAAGARAIEIAHSYGVAKKYSAMPIMGTYAYLKFGTLPLRTLVYPLPHKENPFLGVHLTITSKGEVKIGPSAIPVLGGEQYSFSKLPRSIEIIQFGRSLKSMLSMHPIDTLALIKQELPKILTVQLVKEAARIVPSVIDAGEWQRRASGIRSQLVELDSGDLVQDFLIENSSSETHILNAVSPGWTSAFSFSKWLYEKYVLPGLLG